MNSILIADVFGYSAAVVGIITFIPQAYSVWKTKNTKGISLLTFILLSVISVLWIIYGILREAYPVLLVNAVVLFLAVYISWMKFKNG